jgi:Rad3-related DNA helicase
MDDEKFLEIFPFDAPRDGQREIIERVISAYDGGADTVVLCAPTAVGKSPIAVALANYYGKAYILTSQKSLQDQYLGDFEKIGMRTIKGKYNYNCSNNPGLKCDVCDCVTKKRPGCTYIMARKEAYDSHLSVFNYTYFLNMSRTTLPCHVPRELMIWDEAHGVESELISFMTVKFDADDFKKYDVPLIVRIPGHHVSEEEKIKWLFGDARTAFKRVLAIEEEEFERMDKDSSKYYRQSRKVSYLDTMVCMINRLEESTLMTDGDIVITQNAMHDISFKPLVCTGYGASYLHNYGKKVLAMSATLFDKEQYCKDLGLDPNTVEFIECDSPIPVDKRPILNLSTCSMSYKNKERSLPILKEMVEEILHVHEGERGIIHTVSYDIAKYLIDNIRTDRFVLPKGKKRDSEIKRFMESFRDDLVLISPSLTEGISLDDDLSRFTVVCKVPFGNLGDPWIKKRLNMSQRWYNNTSIRTLVQMTGRSVRSKDDFAVGYILDSTFDWFYSQNGRRFPKWWKESLQGG